MIFVAVLGAIAGVSMFWAGVPESQSQKAAPALRDQLRVVANTRTVFALTPFLIWSMANFGLYTFIATNTCAAVSRQQLSPSCSFCLALAPWPETL